MLPGSEACPRRAGLCRTFDMDLLSARVARDSTGGCSAMRLSPLDAFGAGSRGTGPHREMCPKWGSRVSRAHIWAVSHQSDLRFQTRNHSSSAELDPS